MRFLRNLSLVVLWVAALAASGLGLLLTWPARLPLSEAFRPLGHNTMEELNRAFSRLGVPDWLFLFWLLVLGFCVLVLLAFLFGRPRRLRIERVVDGGIVLMSPQATKNYIATALAPFSDLACRRIELTQGRRGLETTVHAQLRTQDDVSTLERQLIERVHTALTKDLGIQNVSKVRVVIKEFGLPKGIQPKAVPAVSLPEAEAPRPAETAPGQAAAVSEPAPGQAVSGIYPAPAESARAEINDKGNLVLPASSSESASGERTGEKPEGERSLAEEREDESKRADS